VTSWRPRTSLGQRLRASLSLVCMGNPLSPRCRPRRQPKMRRRNNSRSPTILSAKMHRFPLFQRLCAILLFGAVASAPARACDDGHWIDEVVADGQILKLEDGSLWKVDPTDTLTSSGFLFRTSLFATTKS